MATLLLTKDDLKLEFKQTAIPGIRFEMLVPGMQNVVKIVGSAIFAHNPWENESPTQVIVAPDESATACAKSNGSRLEACMRVLEAVGKLGSGLQLLHRDDDVTKGLLKVGVFLDRIKNATTSEQVRQAVDGFFCPTDTQG